MQWQHFLWFILMRRQSPIMKPDSKQIIHSSCWRSMLVDTFLCLLIAEGMKWGAKVFSFSWIKNSNGRSWKKICRGLYRYACIKGLKGDLGALFLICIYSAPHVLQFPLMTSKSWGKKVCLFSFPWSLFLSVFNYWWALFVSLWHFSVYPGVQGGMCWWQERYGNSSRI